MRRSSPLVPIFLIVLVDILGLTLILPLLPFYAEQFGANAAQVGLLVSTYAAFQFFSSPLIGRWSDRIGRKPMLLISQLGTFAGFLLLARAWSLPIVFLSRMIDGATAGNLSVAQAYIADVTEPQNRAKSFALIGISFGLGFLVGPAVSGVLAQYGNVYPIYAAAGLSALSILATATLLPGGTHTGAPESAPNAGAPESAPNAGEKAAAGAAGGGTVKYAESGRPTLLDLGIYTRYFGKPAMRPLLVQISLFFLSFTMFTSGIALFAERRLTYQGHPFGAREVGFVFAYTGLLGVLWQGGAVGRLVKRFGDAAIGRAGFIAAAVGFCLLSLTHGIPMLVFAATISSFGVAVLRPVLMSQISQAADKREQGAVLGLTSSLNSLAAIVAPALGGVMIHHGLLDGWAVTVGGLSFVGFVLAQRIMNAARAAGAPSTPGSPTAG